MTTDATAERQLIIAALDLPGDANDAAMVERIEALRLVRDASTLDQVRRVLAVRADASALACAAALCARLPVGWHHAAVLAMQIVEVNERSRSLQVGMIRSDAIRAARDGSAM